MSMIIKPESNTDIIPPMKKSPRLTQNMQSSNNIIRPTNQPSPSVSSDNINFKSETDSSLTESSLSTTTISISVSVKKMLSKKIFSNNSINSSHLSEQLIQTPSIQIDKTEDPPSKSISDIKIQDVISDSGSSTTDPTDPEDYDPCNPNGNVTIVTQPDIPPLNQSQNQSNTTEPQNSKPDRVSQVNDEKHTSSVHKNKISEETNNQPQQKSFCCFLL